MTHFSLTKNSRNRIGICFLALIFATLVAGPVAWAGVEEKLPADTLLYAHWAGRSLTFDGSQFGQMLQHDSTMEFIKLAFTQGMKAVDSGDYSETVSLGSRLLDIAWQRPITIAFTGLSQETVFQRGYLFIELGKDKPEVEKILNELLTTLTEKKFSTVQFGNGSYTLVPDVEEKVVYGFSGDTFFLTFGQAKEQAEAILGDPAGANLSTSKKFVDSMKDVGGADVQAAFYVDVESIMNQAEEQFFPQKPTPGTQPATAAVSMLKQITTALGVEKVTVIAGTIRIVDKGMLSKLKIFSPAPHTGLLMPFAGAPLSEADISAIPADADFAMVINLDPTALLAEIRKSVAGVSFQASAIFNGALFAGGKPLGISIEKDIINNLGDTWLISMAESQGGLLTGTVVSVEIKDPEAAKKTMAKIERFVRRKLNPQSRKRRRADQPEPVMTPSEMRRMKIRPRLEKMAVDDVEIHYLRTPAEGPGMAFLPAWAIHGTRLYVALWPQVIASTITNKTQPLTETEAFQKLQKRVSDKSSMMSYVNTPQIAKRLYPLQLVFGTMMSNFMKAKLDVNKLPLMPDTIENVLKLLQPEIGVVSHDETGITIEGFGSSPSAAVAVPAVAGSVSILLPALNRARFTAKKAVSMSNLKGIGLAVAMYSVDNDDKYPEHLGLLIDGSYFDSEKIFKSPVSDKPVPEYDPETKKLSGPMDYIYIYYNNKPGIPGTFLQVYEDPANYKGKGTFVLFCDGHVAWTDMRMFREYRAEALKAGGKEVPARAPAAKNMPAMHFYDVETKEEFVLTAEDLRKNNNKEPFPVPGMRVVNPRTGKKTGVPMTKCPQCGKWFITEEMLSDDPEVMMKPGDMVCTHCGTNIAEYYREMRKKRRKESNSGVR